jgi:cysteine sulfinate desulfinase/cysteine desulfurase-like protein
MGVAEEVGLGAVRFSLGRTTRRAELDRVVEHLSPAGNAGAGRPRSA